MKRLLWVFLTLFSLTSAARTPIGFHLEPNKVGEATIMLNVYGELQVVGEINDIILRVHFPYETERQEVVSYEIPRDYTFSTVGENKIVNFYFATSKGKNNFNYTVWIKTHPTALQIKNNPSFPLELSSVSGYEEYISDTNWVKVTDSISEKSRQIVGNSSSLLEAVKRLSHWVYSNIEYDGVYADKILEPEEILETKRGVCDEYTLLFMALAKAAGIPTRFVGGVAYSGEQWYWHAWAHVYVPETGWVPVDPTYDQVGMVDAFHISFTNSKDYSGILQGAETGERSIGSMVDIPVLEFKANTAEITDVTKPFEFSLEAPQENVSQNALLDINTLIKNNLNAYQVQVVRVFKSADTLLLGSPERSFLLSPLETKNVSWRFLTPSNLSAGYLHLRTVVFTGFLEEKNTTVSIDPRLSETGEKSIGLDGSVLEKKGSLVVHVDISNQGNKKIDHLSVRVGIEGLGEKNTETTLEVGEEKTLEFEYLVAEEKPGYEINITASNSAISNWLTILYKSAPKKGDGENQSTSGIIINETGIRLPEDEAEGLEENARYAAAAAGLVALFVFSRFLKKRFWKKTDPVTEDPMLDGGEEDYLDL